MGRVKKSVWLPVVLLVYLAAMSYIGRGELAAGHYLYYFGIIGATLVCIIALHFTLRRRERLREEREREMNRGRDRK